LTTIFSQTTEERRAHALKAAIAKAYAEGVQVGMEVERVRHRLAGEPEGCPDCGSTDRRDGCRCPGFGKTVERRGAYRRRCLICHGTGRMEVKGRASVLSGPCVCGVGR